MEKKARAVLVSTAVILAAMLLVSWQSRPPEPGQVQVGTASVQDIYNSVTISGTVEAADSTALCPAENAVVAAVYASVGDTVEQGGGAVHAGGRAGGTAGRQHAGGMGGGLRSGVADRDRSGNDVLRAPVAGTVLTIPAGRGGRSRGLPCIRVADLSRLQVRAQSPELYAGSWRQGSAPT